MSDLQKLADLDRHASKGEWYVERTMSEGEYGSGEDARSGFYAYQICIDADILSAAPDRVLFDSLNSTEAEVSEEWDGDGLFAWDAVASANAEFIVACVNYVRAVLSALPAPATDAGVEEALAMASRYEYVLRRAGRVPAAIAKTAITLATAYRTQAAEIERLREAAHNMLVLARPHFSDGTQMLAISEMEAALAAQEKPA